MKSTLLIESQYFPSIPVLSIMQSFDCIRLEKMEMFQKSSYRNRCSIYNANGFHALSVPLKDGRNQKKIIAQVEIDLSYQWQRNQWNSLLSSYGRSPYFEFYRDSLELVLFNKYTFLWDLNLATLKWMFEAFQWSKTIDFTSSYSFKTDDNEDDKRSYFRPSNNNNAIRSDVPVYSQVFQEKHGFIPNLSGLDLLFNLGPASNRYLTEYASSEISDID